MISTKSARGCAALVHCEPDEDVGRGIRAAVRPDGGRKPSVWFTQTVVGPAVRSASSNDQSV